MNIQTRTIETSAAAAKGLQQTAASMTDNMTRVSAAVADQTQATLQESTNAAMTKAEELTRFGQANLEALTKSAQIWAVGVQDLSKQVATSFQASTQETLNAVKAFGSVKSVREAIDLQSNFVRDRLEKTMSESGRLTEASLDLFGRVLAPITERVRVTIETFGKAA